MPALSFSGKPKAMAETAVSVLILLLLAASLILVPLGLPGVWVMVALLLGMTVAGVVSWTTWAVLAGLAVVSEALEFAVLGWMGRKHGGSQRAFWGAVAGGLVGAVVGVPIPVVGPLVGGVLGTFAGAGAVTFHETRSMEQASRVGWGVALARAFAVALKTGVGIVVLVTGGLALFV